MTLNIKVRKAQFTDIDSMIGLLIMLFSVEADFTVDEGKQRRGLEMMLADEQTRCILVAEYQGQVIGMCSAQLLVSTAAGGLKALVEDVVIAMGYRGYGIGRQLLAALENWAVTSGARRLDLLADRHNDGGLKFYDRMQWRRTNLIALQKVYL